MKKIIALMGSFSLTAYAGATVVACDNLGFGDEIGALNNMLVVIKEVEDYLLSIVKLDLKSEEVLNALNKLNTKVIEISDYLDFTEADDLKADAINKHIDELKLILEELKIAVNNELESIPTEPEELKI